MFLRNYITEFVKIISFLFTMVNPLCVSARFPRVNLFASVKRFFSREKIKNLVAWKLEA